MEIHQVFLDKALGLGLPLSMIHDALLSTMTGSTYDYEAAASELIIKCSGSASSVVSTRPAAEITETDLHAFTQREIAAEQREERAISAEQRADQREASAYQRALSAEQRALSAEQRALSAEQRAEQREVSAYQRALSAERRAISAEQRLQAFEKKPEEVQARGQRLAAVDIRQKAATAQAKRTREALLLAPAHSLPPPGHTRGQAPISAETMEVRLLGLRLAAEQGDMGSQFALGLKYELGEGVEVDKAKTAQLYGRAAEQGHAAAQCNLGSCYANGEGVEMDVAKAAQLYGQAAEQGLADAQYELGTCYALGKGVEVDKAKAVQLYEQAVEQDHASAQLWLGWCSEHGQGVAHSGSGAFAAVEMYRRALEGGCKIANVSLGLCFEKRRAVLRSNPAEFYVYAAEASLSGEEEFKEAVAVLPDDSLAPDVPSAPARARTRRAVYLLNLAARLGHVAATQQLEALAGRRDAVSACCVGCGAVRKLKTCSKCRVARFCDMECTARMWPAHKASCKAWRAASESAGSRSTS
jgi:TPR repeat protein